MTDTFGDFDVDDALDTEPPAPEQVAYRLHLLRAQVDAYRNAIGLPTWDELTPDEQEVGLGIGEVVVNYVVTHHAAGPEGLARTLHNVRRYWARSPLATWDQLKHDERAVGVDLMSLILGWLRRQGAIA